MGEKGRLQVSFGGDDDLGVVIVEFIPTILEHIFVVFQAPVRVLRHKVQQVGGLLLGFWLLPQASLGTCATSAFQRPRKPA